MRPDRIIVGECRRGEAFDMLQAMNTGHAGSMSTLHANSTRAALSRLETLCLLGGVDLPLLAIRKQICEALDLVVQIKRFRTGVRKVVAISEITGLAESPDGRALFVNIQHPGEDTPAASIGDPSAFTSHWPGGGTSRPRSATIVITKNDGGVIGV
jgi:pilus assembly protein CpaF